MDSNTFLVSCRCLDLNLPVGDLSVVDDLPVGVLSVNVDAFPVGVLSVNVDVFIVETHQDGTGNKETVPVGWM